MASFLTSSTLLAETGSDRSTPLRIMPLGDSITEAQGGYASYRYWLWHKLKDAQLAIDFVGTREGVYRGKPRFSDFDADHEGRWGWRTDQVLQKLRVWAEKERPDLALVHLGSNDFFQGESIESITKELGQVVDDLRQVNPKITILLAEIIPFQDSPPRLVRLNQAIKKLCQEKDRPGSPVRCVEQWRDFEPGRDTYDGVHPNESGERKMAEKWFAAIMEVQNGW